jgi:hypothetical protein
MEVTCWHCCAVSNPETSGKRCPNCGHHPDAWLAKLRFAAGDFIGPIVLLFIGISQLQADRTFSLIFLGGSFLWAGFIYFQDTENWEELSVTDLKPGESDSALHNAPLSKPAMPDDWKLLAATPSPRKLGTATASAADKVLSQSSPIRRAIRLTWAEQVLIATLVCGLVAYVVARWQSIEDLVQHGKLTLSSLVSPAIIFCIVVYVAFAVQRIRADEPVLRDGVLTTGVLTGWYDKSHYSRAGFQSYIRIRYQFWTESGQKFEGSGTLTSENSIATLSIDQEPLKVFYLPQNPGRNVALCCTAESVRRDEPGDSESLFTDSAR